VAVTSRSATTGLVPDSFEDPFALPLADLKKEMVINLDPVYVAAQALKGFKELPDGVPKVFIQTGNIQNKMMIFPGMLTLGVGKSATAHLLEYAASAYGEKRYW
jgi:hypothetical protein